MLWHIVQGHGTKHNAMAPITLSWHKHNAAAKKSTMAQKTLQQHKVQSHSTKRNAMAHKQCCSTKIALQNAIEECAMPWQKNKKPKMPPTTMTTMLPRPPKPNRLIVFPPQMTTKQQPLQKNITIKAKMTVMMQPWQLMLHRLIVQKTVPWHKAQCHGTKIST